MLLESLFLAILAALLAWVLFQVFANSRKKPTPQLRFNDLERANHIQRDQTIDSSEGFNSVTELSGVMTLAGDPMVDAVRCLKFGRAAQAIDILKTAFRSHSESLEIGLKLAELLLSTNDLKEFHKVEATFKTITKETGPFWEALQIIKTDHFGVDHRQENSSYTDFNLTGISNLASTYKRSGYNPIGQPSQQA